MTEKDAVLAWLKSHKEKWTKAKNELIIKKRPFDMVASAAVRIDYLNEFISERERQIKERKEDG